MTRFATCEACGGERLTSSLIHEDGRVRCSNRGACDTDRRRRAAYEKARQGADARDPDGANSVLTVACIDRGESELERKRRKTREHMRALRAARASKRQGSEEDEG